ncbi:NAD(P)-dependent oxidoreductase [Paraburkholderia tagetis]|uniref:NAD(P)-dependent oxidoreductase n=1 Tax=Paraburkholderia tagetis TaxID=2913261 RepID=A0A9X1RKY1_9BURK|nr:NAD(P)-dependent oxidoreductase [Paraburkholderia tagetis]MCG5072074.1 NAD(P)-dependent oxidoreductase [Paraburkholderia tagetis]
MNSSSPDFGSIDSSSTIGFIGLGLMGQSIALRLAASGYRLCVWNRESDRYGPLKTAGAVIADSPREVALACDVVCLCVLDAAAVEEVAFGEHGLLPETNRLRLIIDFSTVQPDDTRSFARRAARASCAWIDSPVSGGPDAAQRGELTLMLGGPQDAVRRAMPLLAHLGSRISHVGDTGKGQEMKVLNQALVGTTFVMLAEALALARRLGLPLEAVPRCLEGGFADSAGLQRVWPRMAAEGFDPPTGRAGQMLKDLKNVDAVRSSTGVALPLLEAALEQYRRYVDSAGPEVETVSISRLYSAFPDAMP